MKTSTSGTTQRNDAHNEERILLICPPFQSPTLSSISIAQLATYLKSHGIQCNEAYLNLDLFHILGRQKYININSTDEGRDNGNNAELLFAEAMHGPLSNPDLAAELDRLVGDGEAREKMMARFENRLTARLRYERPTLVGITTSFNQLVAALWMAKKIKRFNPDTRIVLGGTACAAPMGAEIAKAYPEVDYVVSGYGERPMLRLAQGERPSERVIVCDEFVDLESLPLPEYRPFLREVTEKVPDLHVSLMFQSSRGCWWGQKRHCAFCGLNGKQMAFHAKSHDQVLDEIRLLWERHGCRLIATDCIMAREHLRELLPGLARFQERPTVFYELKANMTEDDVIAMSEANVSGQVGIESLNTRLLKLLRKGVSAIRILALLKWSREYQVDMVWNQLCGIPGESVEDYDAQIALMTRIPHFKPPHRVNPIVIDRFSPYFEEYESFGWRAIKPIPQYRAAHPHLDENALRDIAHHFEGMGGVSTEAYIERFEAAVDTWKQRHQNGDGLYWSRFDGMMRIEDGTKEHLPVSDAARRIIDATHRIVPVKRVVDQTECDPALLDEMVENGFLFIEKGNVVNLVVRTGLG